MRPLSFRTLICTSIAAIASLFCGRAAAVASGTSSSSVKVAGLKILPTLGDKAGNFARFERFAREAAQAGAKVLVTPEGFLDGYAGNTGFFPEITPARLRELAEPADGPYVTRARQLARELEVLLVFGCSEKRGDQVFNTAFLIDPDGRTVGRYSKSHLDAVTEALYAPGTEFPVFSTAVGRVGMLICFDRQPPEPARILGVRGARLVLIPGYSRNVGEVNEVLLLRVRAFTPSPGSRPTTSC